MAKEEKNVFGEGFEEVKAGEFIKWTEVGQMVKGIFVDRDLKDDQLKGGQQWVYTLEGEDGVEFRVGSRGKGFDSAMKKIVPGQWVALHYAEDIKSKTAGNHDFKLIKVGAGGMDDEWVAKNVTTEETGTPIEDIPME